MSNLSELLPAGGAAKEFEVVASGTLPNGSPVVLKSDGTVEVVGLTSTTYTESIPASSGEASNGTDGKLPSVAFDPSNPTKFVIAYAGSASYGTAVVGTISGNTMSFGTPVVFKSASITATAVAFDPNTTGSCVIAYGNTGISVLGTVSGTSISFGSPVTFNNASTDNITVSFDPNTAGKFVIGYKDIAAGNYGTATVGTVSGATISYGSEYNFNSTGTNNPKIAYDPNTAGRFVAVLSDQGASSYGVAVVGTVTGTSISYGADVTFSTGVARELSLAFDANNADKFVVCYKNQGNSNYGTAIVGTVSGTSTTFGSEYVFNNAETQYTAVAIEPRTGNKFVVSYQDAGNSNKATAIVGTVSGTSITFGSESILSTQGSYEHAIAFSPAVGGKFVAAFKDQASDFHAKASLGKVGYVDTVTNLTSTNFAGTSTAAFTNGQTATIVPQGGVSTNQSSLTTGSTYYVQDDGTLATSAGDPSVVAGKAISTTSIILKGNS
jgi:hypothetical protein